LNLQKNFYNAFCYQTCETNACARMCPAMFFAQQKN
jgi:hypothetical protein